MTLIRPETIRRTAHLMAKNAADHKVSRNAAGLAYYLLFAVFPLLIFISNLLGMLDLNAEHVTEVLARILPSEIAGLAGTYLEYVSQVSSRAMMWFSLVFTVWFPMRAAGGLMDDVRRAHHLGKPARPVLYRAKQLMFTVVLLVAIALTLLFSTLGQRILEFLIAHIPAMNHVNVSDVLIQLWHYLRFLAIALLLFASLGALYGLARDRRHPVRNFLPGATIAVVAELAASVGFSFYVERFANYSMIYGTLGAVVALLIWLYMTSLILILGAELNAALELVRSAE